MNGESELPEGWSTAILGDLIIDIQPGFACGEHNREGEGHPHLRPMNVSTDGKIDLTVVKYIPSEKVDSNSKILKFGDVLFNNTNSTELVGKTAFYNLKESHAFSNHMTRIRCNPKILDSPYCALYIHELWREGYFGEHCNKHVSQSSISRNVLAETPVIFPPLAEQHRIVATMEAILARVNASQERLDRVPGLLKAFRQAVLAAACSGRLTEGWRGEYFNQVKTKEVGIPDENCNNLFPIPEFWIWTKVGEKTQNVQYGLSIKANDAKETGIPILRMGNIQDGTIDFTDLKYILADEKEISQFYLEKGDLLFNRTNSPELVGKSAVFNSDEKMTFASYLIRIKVNQNDLLPEYLNYWTNSVWGREWARMVRTDGVSQSNINASKIKEMLLPLPPLPEQHEIIRRVEALFALADRIEQRVATGKERADRLTQAILAKAFRGELVPTEAELARIEGREYEPASALLERIRKERESQGETKPRMRKIRSEKGE